MKLLFNKHRKYGANPKVAGMEKGLDCKPGRVHDLPDALKSDKFFQAHLKKGDCSFVEAPSSDEADEAPSQKPQGKSR